MGFFFSGSVASEKAAETEVASSSDGFFECGSPTHGFIYVQDFN